MRLHEPTTFCTERDVVGAVSYLIEGGSLEELARARLEIVETMHILNVPMHFKYIRSESIGFRAFLLNKGLWS